MSKRAYKPTTLRALEGGRSHSLAKPEDTNEPRPRPIAPKCPDDIDNQAKKIWKRLAPKLEKMGLLTETDGDMFGHLCQIRSRLVAIHNFIKKENKSLVQLKVTIDGSGQEHVEAKPSPYVIMEKHYYDLFRKYAGEFGLSPRGRVGLTVGMTEDEGEDLLSH